jgi:hypothetical protein
MERAARNLTAVFLSNANQKGIAAYLDTADEMAGTPQPG